MAKQKTAARRTSRNRAGHRGGTIVGLLLGLVAGLAIAVVVAAYVTKAPVPFVDKFARSGDTLPLEPPPEGQAAPDPNNPLYSRTDAMPSEVQRPSEPPSDPIRSLLATLGQLGSGGRDEPQPEQQQGEPRSWGGAPVVNRTQPPAGQQMAAADPQAGAAGYLLQAGAFRSRPDADAMRARLALMGFEARVLSSQVNGETLYRVRLGPYAGLDDMNRARTRLSENGIEASVVRQR